MKRRNRTVDRLQKIANGTITYILTTVFGFLIYVIIPFSLLFPFFALFDGHYILALATGALDFILFFCFKAIGRKRIAKAQAKELAAAGKKREQQLEEIASLRHNLREDYAQGKISDEQFDEVYDCILQMESEAGISMLDSDKIDYEGIYRSAQLKAQVVPKNSESNQVTSCYDRRPTKRKASHNIFLTINCFLGAICIICVIGAVLTLMRPPGKTAFPRSTETQAASEYMTEPRPGILLNRIVYISKSGHKIHLHSDCSGMKDYSKMTYEAACKAGYKHCSRCFN